MIFGAETQYNYVTLRRQLKSRKPNSSNFNQKRERERAGNKIYVKWIIKETNTLIDIQDNVGQPDKAKVIANREMLSTKIHLIKSFDEQILDSIDTDADMEREIF